MLFLVIDTSGTDGFVALARSGDDASGEAEVIESVALAGGTFSAQLVSQIAALLQSHGLSKSNIDAFIVASGPGSFTGIRVGLTVVKALAEVLQKPIVAVSRLEMLAVSAGRQGRVVAVLDAGRGDIYWGEYEVSGKSSEMVSERLLSADEFLDAAKDVTPVTSDKALMKSGNVAWGAPSRVTGGDAATFTRVGARKLAEGKIVSPEQLDANYIRLADAKPSSSV